MRTPTTPTAPLLQIVADQKLGHALGSPPMLGHWENSPRPAIRCVSNDVRLDQVRRAKANLKPTTFQVAALSMLQH
jgi:hypothetical protein